MRILTPIGSPFPGEHVAGVQPELAPEVADHWNVRLNLYTGRALSHTALQHEQQGRAGRLATRGQMVSPGVVSGLEVSLERGDEVERPRHYYQIAAGMGLTASGEDVIVRRSLRVNVLDVQVCGPAALFSTTGGASGGGSSSVSVDGSSGAVAHQVGGWTLGRLLWERARNGVPERDAPHLPRVGILVLQPVETEEVDQADTTDPCEEDPQNYAFEDWQRVDGSRLLWYVWPTVWRRLPKADRLRRNQIAYTIFDAELANGPEDLLPWERFGVPLALVAFNRRWKPLFADRNAVARAGGKPRRRTPTIQNTGNPFLWQARLQQFAEHVGDVSVPGGPVDQEWDGAHFDLQSYATPALSRQFRFLPPAGLLPRAVLNFAARRQAFFPNTYRVDAAPVPLEQLDVAMEGSAALAPFDRFTPDEVQILVPVPQAWFEPNLLNEETVSSAFIETIDALVRRRSKWLLRRGTVRQRKAVIDRAIGNPDESYPDPDPSALDANEAIASDQIDTTFSALAEPEPSFGTNVEGVDLVSSALSRLRAYLSTETPLYDDVSRVLFDVGKIGLTAVEFRSNVLAATALGGKVTYDEAARQLVYTARPDPMKEAERTELKDLAPQIATYVRAVDELFAISQGSAFGPFFPFSVLGYRIPGIPGGLATALGERSAGIPGGFANIAGERVAAIPGIFRRPAFGSLGNVSSRVRLSALPFAKSYLAEVASGKVWYDELGGYLVYTPRPEAMTPAERDALLTPHQLNASYAAAVNTLYDRSQRNEVGLLDRLGLRKFIDHMAKKINAAEDKIDLSFVRVQTDIYRLRQLMLGSNAATRLATSPVLASIAKGESAFATQESLKDFIAEAKAVGPRVEGPNERDFRATPPTIASRVSAPADGAASASKTAADRLVPGDVFATALLAARAPVAAAAALRLPDAKKEAVVGQAAIVGRPLDFRSVTIAERLEQPKAPEAKNSAVATKASVITELAALGINLDDLKIPGFNVYDDATGKLLEYELVTQDQKVKRVIPKETRYTFLDVSQRGLAAEVLQGYHDLDPTDGDESAFFAMAVRALDHAVAVLRVVEGRIQAYSTALDRCRETLAELEAIRVQVDARLHVIESELAETRHDVSVTRALLAEEQARVAEVNARRARIIAEHAPYLAFRRPRSSDLFEAVPLRHLDPAAVEPAIPTCLTHRVEAPSELRAMVGLLREVPVRWFRYVSDVVDRLDRLETIRQTLQYAKVRAGVQYQARLAAAPGPSPAAGVGLGASIQRVFAAHQDVVSHLRALTAQLDLSDLASQSWQAAREKARQALSLGDLADADHGRSEVARAAAQELEMISQVAACLYARFGEVAPQIRLVWAQQLSQYDDPVNLRNLASLPRWDAIDYLDRRELQGLADWLFERMDAGEPQALALVSDLVRLCILLASHAPVNQIIAGHVHQSAAVQLGGRVQLAVDLAKVRVGMQVIMYSDAPTGREIVARGVVEDLGDGKAAARVIQATHPTVNLSANAPVQFVEADHPDLTPVADVAAAAKPGASMKPGGMASALAGRH
jgi:hypothetical protein